LSAIFTTIGGTIVSTKLPTYFPAFKTTIEPAIDLSKFSTNHASNYKLPNFCSNGWSFKVPNHILSDITR
jgi:hypothetical protein